MEAKIKFGQIHNAFGILMVFIFSGLTVQEACPQRTMLYQSQSFSMIHPLVAETNRLLPLFAYILPDVTIQDMQILLAVIM
jgi:hypothetical protein